MCMYVSEICAEGFFVTFFWWLKNVKSRSKIALFSNERYFEIWFPKKRTITFFWSKLSKLHKKDPILHVATTFSLKQGERRTSHGPIPHPLSCHICISRFLRPAMWVSYYAAYRCGYCKSQYHWEYYEGTLTLQWQKAEKLLCVQ